MISARAADLELREPLYQALVAVWAGGSSRPAGANCEQHRQRYMSPSLHLNITPHCQSPSLSVNITTSHHRYISSSLPITVTASCRHCQSSWLPLILTACVTRTLGSSAVCQQGTSRRWASGRGSCGGCASILHSPVEAVRGAGRRGREAGRSGG